MRKVAILIGTLFLTGCASTGNYEVYARTQSEIATARAYAEGKRYEALAKFAEMDSEGARIAAVMALQADSNNGLAPMKPPNEPMDKWLDWSGAILPEFMTIFAVTATD